MSYYMRFMSREDLVQVSEIDQEAFPTIHPPVNYERELQTPLAHYIVAYEEETPPPPAEPATTRRRYLLGFAGLWLIADEAHVTNIAVREGRRRQGIGELMFISMIDLALALKAQVLTLEVRVSNTAAQSLYRKYALDHTYVRRNYYTDNKESALVMTSRDITTRDFQQRFQVLKRAHSRKWGIALYHVAR